MTSERLKRMPRRTLANDLAERIKEFVQSSGLQPGDRLPSMATMSKDLGVGGPTLREGLKYLEAVGVVTIRHGSGVYVSRADDSLMVSNPMREQRISRKLLLDLMIVRIPIEVAGAGLAAQHATAGQLVEMKRLLALAAQHLDEDDVLNVTNMAFHREIAKASGNIVIAQVLGVFTELFSEQQRQILNIQNSRREDHAEHVATYEAIARRDPALAAKRMKRHLEGVRSDLEAWDPEKRPIH